LVASLRIDASVAGYREALTWARQFKDRRWAVENARGLGRHFAQWLIGKGEVVHDVPATATERVRELSGGGQRKTDAIDAAAAASVAALHGDASIVVTEDHTTICSMLEERRSNMAQQRARVTNQLHAMFRDLIPGGAAVALTAASSTRLLSTIRPVNDVERFCKQIARDLVKDPKAVDASLTKIEDQMKQAVATSGSRLGTIDGVGPITAVRLLGRVGHASRFRSEHASRERQPWC